ncbi:MAG: hypothetical protein JST82_11005 [Bacteroidetes bacterium]|nr:hypothetical protein [Bacteroidota bacterium]
MAVKKIYQGILAGLICGAIVIACQKTPETKTDDRLTRHYCNDPDAVNFNKDFPGIPDNTICYYPTQLFKGSYKLYDSILDGDFKLRKLDTLPITLTALNNTRLILTGFCEKNSTTDTILLTADKYYKAMPDSTKAANNLVLNGWILCRKSDTLTGYLQKPLSDSSLVIFKFTVASDTGIYYHYGTAKKQ